MTEQNKKYLSDILRAVELIEQFVSSVNTYADFITDLKTQSAVERQLGIIGEAVNKYEKSSHQNPLLNARSIVAFRNRLNEIK